MPSLSAIARLNGVDTLEGSYLPTAKNGLVSDLYKKLGFARAGGTDDHQIWKLDISAFNVPALPFEFVRDGSANG